MLNHISGRKFLKSFWAILFSYFQSCHCVHVCICMMFMLEVSVSFALHHAFSSQYSVSTATGSWKSVTSLIIFRFCQRHSCFVSPGTEIPKTNCLFPEISGKIQPWYLTGENQTESDMTQRSEESEFQRNEKANARNPLKKSEECWKPRFMRGGRGDSTQCELTKCFLFAKEESGQLRGNCSGCIEQA